MGGAAAADTQAAAADLVGMATGLRDAVSGFRLPAAREIDMAARGV